MEAMEYETTTLELADGVATLTLNRPETLNALSMRSLVDLRAALKEVVAAREARCLVITGAGRGFCTGVDLNAPRPGLNPSDPDEFLRDYFVPAYQLLTDLEIPTIAAVNGPCAGAGMSLALSCDIVVAARSSYFLQPFVNIGLVPDMGSSWLIPHAIGSARAAGLMLLGEKLPADKAAEWGLIWKCVDDGALMQEVGAMTARFAGGARLAHSLTKQLLRHAHRNDLRAQVRLELESQRLAMGTDDFREAKRAFAEKRLPVFGR